MKNSQSNKPSETFIFLYVYIIQDLFSQICNHLKDYSVNPKIENDDIHIAIWKKFEGYKEKALLNMSGTRLDRHKLASCICGTIIEIKPLVGFNGARINKYANEWLALQVGLDVVKVNMIHDMIRNLQIPTKDIKIVVEYMKDNFNMKLPSLEDNICDKHSYVDNLIIALFKTHSLCNSKQSECFHYDIFAYSKIFYHLELYNRENLKKCYQEYIKHQSLN